MNLDLSPLRQALRRFAHNHEGAVVVEAVIVLPLFIWAYIGLYAFWDGFRSNNTFQKAAFTISDMLSREQVEIGQVYIDGLQDLAGYLVDEDQQVRLRVTSVSWSDVDKKFLLHWSASSRSSMAPVTQGMLQSAAYSGLIPQMSAGDYVVIVEMEVDYHPAFDSWMGDQVFSQFVVTRPRFVPCLRFKGAATCAGA